MITATRPRAHGLNDRCIRATRNGKHRDAERLRTLYYKNQTANDQRRLDKFLHGIHIADEATDIVRT